MKVVETQQVFEAEMFAFDGHIPENVVIYKTKDSLKAFLDTNFNRQEIFNGWWVVTNEQGRKEAFSPEEFHKKFERQKE